MTTHYHYYTELTDSAGQVKQRTNGDLSYEGPITSGLPYAEVHKRLEEQARKGFPGSTDDLHFHLVNLNRLN